MLYTRVDILLGEAFFLMKDGESTALSLVVGKVS
jgi:hypothetical protein